MNKTSPQSKSLKSLKKFEIKDVTDMLRSVEVEKSKASPRGEKVQLAEKQLREKEHRNKMLINRLKKLEKKLKRENVLRIKAMEVNSKTSQQDYREKKLRFLAHRNEIQSQTISPEKLDKKIYEKIEMVKTHCFHVPKFQPFHLKGSVKKMKLSKSEKIIISNKERERQKISKNADHNRILSNFQNVTFKLIQEELKEQRLMETLKKAKEIEKKIKLVPKKINFIDIHKVDLISQINPIKNPNRNLAVDLISTSELTGNFGLNKKCNSLYNFKIDDPQKNFYDNDLQLEDNKKNKLKINESKNMNNRSYSFHKELFDLDSERVDKKNNNSQKGLLDKKLNIKEKNPDKNNLNLQKSVDKNNLNLQKSVDKNNKKKDTDKNINKNIIQKKDVAKDNKEGVIQKKNVDKNLKKEINQYKVFDKDTKEEINKKQMLDKNTTKKLDQKKNLNKKEGVEKNVNLEKNNLDKNTSKKIDQKKDANKKEKNEKNINLEKNTKIKETNKKNGVEKNINSEKTKKLDQKNDLNKKKKVEKNIDLEKNNVDKNTTKKLNQKKDVNKKQKVEKNINLEKSVDKKIIKSDELNKKKLTNKNSKKNDLVTKVNKEGEKKLNTKKNEINNKIQGDKKNVKSKKNLTDKSQFENELKILNTFLEEESENGEKKENEKNDNTKDKKKSTLKKEEKITIKNGIDKSNNKNKKGEKDHIEEDKSTIKDNKLYVNGEGFDDLKLDIKKKITIKYDGENHEIVDDTSEKNSISEAKRESQKTEKSFLKKKNSINANKKLSSETIRKDSKKNSVKEGNNLRGSSIEKKSVYSLEKNNSELNKQKQRTSFEATEINQNKQAKEENMINKKKSSSILSSESKKIVKEKSFLNLTENNSPMSNSNLLRKTQHRIVELNKRNILNESGVEIMNEYLIDTSNRDINENIDLDRNFNTLESSFNFE